ncbi:helix-turn-helix domain-containing protein [Rhizobium herbae]|uniref:Helix-turn-helix domain-containing protein n=1 Tax=Rhizobium herbae TaxID=508661 RepID=A0ABS4EPA2_9HYPH|nr:helix-turn-helix domain-containing protein [Rhizobium herbae]MBP1859772.1 hypothetical protein [Rhizobium herbae]
MAEQARGKNGIQKHDIAIAQKALNIAAGLSSADKAVASAILDHYNRATGQCDPSLGRLATLLGFDEKTVRRATEFLCSEKWQLFKKDSHGGRSFRASYSPQWAKFRAIVADWDQRMRSICEPQMKRRARTKLSADPGRKCPDTQDKNVQQTNLSNPSYKPISLNETPEQGTDDQEAQGVGTLFNGLLKGKDERAVNRNFLSKERGETAGCSHREAGLANASDRVNDWINRLDDNGASTWAWLADADGVLDAAIQAEMRKRGAGSQFILSAMRSYRLNHSAERGHVH